MPRVALDADHAFILDQDFLDGKAFAHLRSASERATPSEGTITRKRAATYESTIGIE